VRRRASCPTDGDSKDEKTMVKLTSERDGPPSDSDAPNVVHGESFGRATGSIDSQDGLILRGIEKTEHVSARRMKKGGQRCWIATN